MPGSLLLAPLLVVSSGASTPTLPLLPPQPPQPAAPPSVPPPPVAPPTAQSYVATDATAANVTVPQANWTLSNATLSNTTAAQPAEDHTGTSEDDELARLCALWRPAAYVHLAALPVWVVLICTWVLYSLRHEEHVLDLHKLLSWVPLVELVHSLLSAFHFLFCPWRNTIERIWGAAWVVVSILKEPIMLVCLLMLSKGWCITRPHLQYREVVHSSLLITLLYMCVIYELSSRGVGAVVPAVIMFLVMLCSVVSAIVTNLRVLKAQLLVVRAFHIDATTTPAYTKYVMFWALLCASVAFFAADITLNVLAALTGYWPWLLSLLRQALELITAVIIGWHFRARPFNALFEQVH